MGWSIARAMVSHRRMTTRRASNDQRASDRLEAPVIRRRDRVLEEAIAAVDVRPGDGARAIEQMKQHGAVFSGMRADSP